MVTPVRVIFYIDAMYANLGRLLRILGFDTLIAGPDISDDTIMQETIATHRILVTEDKVFYQRFTKMTYPDGEAVQGLLLSEKTLYKQIAEVFLAFNMDNRLLDISNPALIPSRCSRCNTLLKNVKKTDIAARIPAKTFKYVDQYWICPNIACDSIYWIGNHWKNIAATVTKAKAFLERALLKNND